jgi:signal transduction histidine kinase
MPMTGSGPSPLLAAAAYLLPALVWSVIAQEAWHLKREKKPSHGFFQLLPIVATFVTLLYASLALFCLIPPELHRHPPRILIALYDLSNVVHVAMAATLLHLVVYFSLQAQRPSRTWLAANYVPAALMSTLAMFPGLIPAPTFDDSLSRFFVIRNLYIFAMLALVVRQLARVARRGAWRPGGMGEARSTDIAVLAVGVVGAGGWCLLAIFANLHLPPPAWVLFYDITVALCLAAPIAVRVLGEVVRRVLLTTILALATAGIYFGGHAAGAALADQGLESLAHASALGALLLLLIPGQYWLREAIDRIVFRRTRRRREELHAAVQALSPELGTLECSRRALVGLCRIFHLSGAALLLADGTRVAQGAIDIEPLRRLWPQHTAPPPHLENTLAQYAVPVPRDDVRQALAAANVVAVAPVASTQRQWGYLFVSTGFLGATFRDDDARTLEDFAGQLALVLDGTELLARALAVERALAHAEKLAAIGELAARVAHEIRNPVTAARSLAQQLAREATSPFHEEHALILTELERVEHQVAALLRFARREHFEFESVDLPELARATLDAFRSRLEAAHIDVSFASSDHVMARADREKMRQVLVNVLENAIDALASSDGERRLGVRVGSVNGSATLRVTDTGPGVPADALPHLFEPFFSLKATGTGLGLAIAKRTVDAHGGRIEIGSAAGAGTSVQIELPLGDAR